MSNNNYDWTANDYSNIVTIGAAAVGSVLLIVFKSRCTDISICWGLWSCKRKVQEDEEDPEPVVPPQPQT